MHHIHHTEAYILAHVAKREADREIYLYTKDLGLIRAPAQGVRKLSSKLRYVLQDFSLVRVDLVRGRDTWRITSASLIDTSPEVIRNPASLKLMAQVAKLVMRLCQGESPNPEIFEDIVTASRFLNRRDVTAKEQEITELTLVLRILHNLGYVGNTDTLSSYLGQEFLPESISYERLAKKTILFEINRALRESQL